MKLTYHWEGDYRIPNMIPPKSPHIGIWGERRQRFLRTHQRPIYDAMMMRDTLNTHLEEIDLAAEKMLDQLIAQMAEREGLTETMKTENQLMWIQAMNSIKNRAEEIVFQELIYN